MLEIRLRLTLLLLACSLYAHAQNINGSVTDARTGKPVSFATIGLKNQNAGTTAGEDGKFSITSTDPADTLMILCVGYKHRRQPLALTAANSTVNVQLEPDEIALPEARITSARTWKTDELNHFKPDKVHRFITSNGYEVQLAQHLENDHPGAQLTTAILYLRDEPGKETKFRIRIYEADSTGHPGKDLYPSEILVRYTDQMPLTIDLTPYNIYVPGKDFFIAVEWLKIASNAETEGSNSYRPIIGFSNKGSRNDNVWRLNYRNEWYQREITFGKGNLAITAKLRY